MTPVPLLVRAGAFAAALAALLLAVPAELRLAPPVLAGIVLLATLPAVLPDGPWATLVIVAAAGGWALATDRPATAPVLLLGGLLYCVHSLTGLAAALPYDAVVAPDVLVRWLLRTVAVIAAGCLLSVAVLAGLGAVTGAGVHAGATIAGLALAVALAAQLARRSRTEGRERHRSSRLIP
jgi:hypothetical protein